MATTSSPERVLMEGYLLKKGNIVRQWRKRFLRLSYRFDAGHVVEYLAAPLDPTVKGTVHLGRNAACEPTQSSSKQFVFTVRTGAGREYDFAAEDESSRDAWMVAIKTAIFDAVIHSESIGSVERSWRPRASTQPIVSSASVRVIRAEGLDAATDSAEPWARLQFGNEARRTRIGAGEPNAPIWGEIVRCHFRRRPRFFAVDVLDEAISSKGRGTAQAAILGRAVVSLARAAEVPQRRWYPLVGRSSSAGRILLEICVQGDTRSDVLQPLAGLQEACLSMPGSETARLTLRVPAAINQISIATTQATDGFAPDSVSECISGTGPASSISTSQMQRVSLPWPLGESIEDCARVLLRPFDGSDGGVFPGSLVLTSHRLLFVGAYDVAAAEAACVALPGHLSGRSRGSRSTTAGSGDEMEAHVAEAAVSADGAGSDLPMQLPSSMHPLDEDYDDASCDEGEEDEGGEDRAKHARKHPLFPALPPSVVALGTRVTNDSDAMSFALPLGLVVGVDARNLDGSAELATADPVDWNDFLQRDSAGAGGAPLLPQISSGQAESATGGADSTAAPASAPAVASGDGATHSESEVGPAHPHAPVPAHVPGHGGESRHAMGALLGGDGAVIQGALSMTTETDAAAGGAGGAQGGASGWSRSGRRRTESVQAGNGTFMNSFSAQAQPAISGDESPGDIASFETPCLEPGRHPASITAGMPTLKLVCADFRSPRFAFVGGDVMRHHRVAAETGWSTMVARNGRLPAALDSDSQSWSAAASEKESAIAGARSEPGGAACARFFWRLRQHVAAAGSSEMEFARLPSRHRSTTDALSIPSKDGASAAAEVAVAADAGVSSGPVKGRDAASGGDSRGHESGAGPVQQQQLLQDAAAKVLVTTGWQHFDMVRELARQGVGGASSRWRITRLNRKYEFCSTYPRFFAVPAAVPDDQLAAVGKFRSRSRVPALSWRHPVSGASIVRCAQPFIGIAGRRCREDEAMLSAVRCAGADQRGPLALVDMRPLLNALANRTAGKGYESTGLGQPYSDCSLWFGNIENIHVMRDSLRALLTAISRTPQSMTAQRLPGAEVGVGVAGAVTIVSKETASSADDDADRDRDEGSILQLSSGRIAARAAVDAVRRLSFVKAAHALDAQATSGQDIHDGDIQAAQVASPIGSPTATASSGGAMLRRGRLASAEQEHSSPGALRVRRRMATHDGDPTESLQADEDEVEDEEVDDDDEDDDGDGGQLVEAVNSEVEDQHEDEEKSHASSRRAAAAVTKVRMSGGSSGSEGPRARLPKLRGRPAKSGDGDAAESEGSGGDAHAKQSGGRGMFGGFVASIFGGSSKSKQSEQLKQSKKKKKKQIKTPAKAETAAADIAGSSGRAARVSRIRGDSDRHTDSGDGAVTGVGGAMSGPRRRRSSVQPGLHISGEHGAGDLQPGEEWVHRPTDDGTDEALTDAVDGALSVEGTGGISPAETLFTPASPSVTGHQRSPGLPPEMPLSLPSEAGAPPNAGTETLVVRGWTVAPVGDDRGVTLAIERSGWHLHEAGLLSVAVRCARMLDTQGISAKVSCSDGWDRTPQACALTQLLLDPYYRTMEGFGVLIDKEFGGYGHKYKDRAGRGTGRGAAQEASPVMLQFLGCVEQVRLQFPNRFEFTSAFVSAVARMSLDRSTGSFLFDSDAHRDRHRVRTSTASAWAVMLAACGREMSPVPAGAIRNRIDERSITAASRLWVNAAYIPPPLAAMWPVACEGTGVGVGAGAGNGMGTRAGADAGASRRVWLRDEVLIPEHSPRAMRPWGLMTEWESRVHAALETGPGAAPPTAVPEAAPAWS